jgi:hypothetical protein
VTGLASVIGIAIADSNAFGALHFHLPRRQGLRVAGIKIAAGNKIAAGAFSVCTDVR